MRCRNFALLFVPLLCSTLIFSLSCTTEENLLFFADVYFDTVETELDQALSDSLDDIGIRVIYRTITPGTSADSFIEMISQSDARFISASPLLANLVAAAAPVFRDRRFVVPYSDGLVAQDNIQRLASDRTNAFFRAGQLAVNILDESTDELRRLLVLAFVGDETRRRELETFIEGFESVRDEVGQLPNPDIREYGSTDDARGAARVAGETENYSLVIVSLASMNTDVISAIVSTGSVPIITEGPLESVPGVDSVVAVIQEDWIGALVTALDSRNPRIPIPARLLPGPALKRLELATLPAEFD